MGKVKCQIQIRLTYCWDFFQYNLVHVFLVFTNKIVLFVEESGVVELAKVKRKLFDFLNLFFVVIYLEKKPFNFLHTTKVDSINLDCLVKLWKQ